jgi:hypothetical protein
MGASENLGFVPCRSGTLLVIDTGNSGIWSDLQPPQLLEGDLHTVEALGRANKFIDIRVVGVDAERAGKLLDMSWHPLFIYDQPPHHAELDEKLAKLVREHRLDRRFEVLSPRISHRARVTHAIQNGTGAGVQRSFTGFGLPR